MTSVEYDLDTSSGLMPKIQALIAPPESDEATKSKKKEGLELHPYYKRPGKGHNRDCCDACSEGGNLICCDKCPASFHLSCHDPPLDDEDIPLGQWLCHKCRIAAGLPPLKAVRMEKCENGEEAENSVSVNSKEDVTNELPLRGRSRTSSTASIESNKSRGKGKNMCAASSTSSSPIVTVSVAAGPDKLTAIDMLISAASSMNPKQFELPREMVLPINFPGTDRAPLRGRRAAAAKRSRTHDLENGMVPLPAKLCYECRKSCRKAPLLACDYCPLLFHLDCLDPPLTSLPSGRWMCPNHVEQAIDERLLTSLSVTQRVALYDKYTGPIDQDAVKTEFLQKTRRKNPPFRFKIKLAPRNRVVVPNAVRELYKNRPPLIPTLKDVLRDKELLSRVGARSDMGDPDSPVSVRDGPSEKDQEEWLRGLVALQTSIACHLSSKKRRKCESDDEGRKTVKCELIPEDESNEKHQRKIMESTEAGSSSYVGKNPFMNGGLDDTHHENEKVGTVSEKNSLCFLLERKTSVSSHLQNGDATVDDMREIECPGASTRNLKDLDEKKTPIITTVQNASDSKFNHFCSDNTLSKDLSNILEDSVDCYVPDVDLDKLDERLIRLLASQRLQQLTVQASADRYWPSLKSAEDTAGRGMWPSLETGVRPRALLTPLNGSQPPMPLYYRVMEIGSGGDMDICLSYYGHCNFITAKHAVIICDEVNRHYELMNYSEHGTTVDNVLYSCDFSEKQPSKERESPLTPPPPHHGRRSGGSGSAASADAAEMEAEVPPLIQKIRAIVDKRRGVTREDEGVHDESTLPADIGKVDVKCGCRSSSSSLIGAGWEGTALLNHGSFIKFGCIQFTFSILNYAVPQQKQSPTQATGDDEAIENSSAVPHKIVKRERDSTSSSTLTVSPSPPVGTTHSHSTRQFTKNQKDCLSIGGQEEQNDTVVDEDSDEEENMEEKEEEEEEDEEDDQLQRESDGEE